ncbi:cation:proton antiporter [Streptomyces sp. NPDC004266]|uniref:cation:proton antiporter domain-containing protein n=1 Tax=Streptomyces sp. NPDC004266 TaxID=3364693 RepID=UPI003680B51F
MAARRRGPRRHAHGPRARPDAAARRSAAPAGACGAQPRRRLQRRTDLAALRVLPRQSGLRRGRHVRRPRPERPQGRGPRDDRRLGPRVPGLPGGAVVPGVRLGRAGEPAPGRSRPALPDLRGLRPRRRQRLRRGVRRGPLVRDRRVRDQRRLPRPRERRRPSAGPGRLVRLRCGDDGGVRRGHVLRFVVYALLVLVVARFVPVVASLTGTAFSRPERVAIGWLGPRGVTSIVFSVLAFSQLRGEEAVFVVNVTAATVLLSVLLHGVTAEPVARWFARHPRPEETAAPRET